jgi:O-acetylserine/cysteine efflux transporter
MAYITSIAERSRALIALTLAGSTWGLTLPLSAVALQSMAPAWLACLRFGLAALVLGAVAPRSNLRAALRAPILGWGVLGYAGVIMLQGEGIEHTSVSHAAVLGGIVPALVVLIPMVRGARRPSRAVALGLLGAVGGVALVAGGGGHSSLDGDGLVLLAGVFSAVYIVAQPRWLAGRTPVAVTAVQMAAAAIVALPLALLNESTPRVHGPAVLAVLGLVVVGSLLPFTLYAWGQTRVHNEVAGALLNLEALVGGMLGIVAFHDPWGVKQALGMVLMLAGILLVVAKAPRSPAGHSSLSSRSDQSSSPPLAVSG